MLTGIHVLRCVLYEVGVFLCVCLCVFVCLFVFLAFFLLVFFLTLFHFSVFYACDKKLLSS